MTNQERSGVEWEIKEGKGRAIGLALVGAMIRGDGAINRGEVRTVAVVEEEDGRIGRESDQRMGKKEALFFCSLPAACVSPAPSGAALLVTSEEVTVSFTSPAFFWGRY